MFLYYSGLVRTAAEKGPGAGGKEREREDGVTNRTEGEREWDEKRETQCQRVCARTHSGDSQDRQCLSMFMCMCVRMYISGMVETAKVAKSDPTAWIRKLEQQQHELQAYCRTLGGCLHCLHTHARTTHINHPQTRTSTHHTLTQTYHPQRTTHTHPHTHSLSLTNRRIAQRGAAAADYELLSHTHAVWCRYERVRVPRAQESESEGEGDRVTEGGGKTGRDGEREGRSRSGAHACAREQASHASEKASYSHGADVAGVCIRAHMYVCAVVTGLVTTVVRINVMLLTLGLFSPPFPFPLYSIRNPMRAGVSSTTESPGIQAPQMQTWQGRSLSPPPLTRSLHGPGNGRVDSQHSSGAQAARGSTSRTGAVSVSASSTTTPSSDQRFFHF
jgi:hypothetical protein